MRVIKISKINQKNIEKYLKVLPPEAKVYCLCQKCNEKIFKGDTFYSDDFYGFVCEECAIELFEKRKQVAYEI